MPTFSLEVLQLISEHRSKVQGQKKKKKKPQGSKLVYYVAMAIVAPSNYASSTPLIIMVAFTK